MKPASTTTEQPKPQALAQSLDCMTEDDLRALANISPSTAEAWRKRGKGPPYLLFGNRYLYPLEGVAQYLRSIVHSRRSADAKGLL